MMLVRRNVRVVAVIQARMGSTRLPGKVLQPIAGQPLLWHVVHRLKKCRLLNEIAVATTLDPNDQAIVDWCHAHGVIVVRGSQEDVLARYALAAEMLDADIIVRVSSDAPFIDPGFVDHLIADLIAQDGDYVRLADGAVCAHDGVDPFSRRILNRLMRDVADDPVAKEHVSGYFKLHPDFGNVAYAGPYPLLAQKGVRLTIDTPDDLAFVRALYDRVGCGAGEAALVDILLLLEREPALKNINAHVRQKPLSNPGGLALIRCDGGVEFGYGHVTRMVALARALRDCEGLGAQFALHGSEDAAQPIRRAGFDCVMLKDKFHLKNLVRDRHPDLLLLDGRNGPSRAELEEFKRGGVMTAVIDDGDDRRLAADYAYYPPVSGAYALNWDRTATMVRIGWAWALLGFDPHAVQARTAQSDRTVLVAMGGSDPHGLTTRMAQVLKNLGPDLRVRFVIGPGMKDGAKVAAGLVTLGKNYEAIENVSDLKQDYASADVALCAFGVTAYELAALGVPAIYLCQTSDHVSSARTFSDAGMGITLGLAATVGDDQILAAVQELMHNPDRRRAMRQAGLSRLDGHGANRIAADLAAALQPARAI